MLYILRLSNGNCVVTLADDELSARQSAEKFGREHTAEVVSVRRLDSFAVQLSPTDDGSLELAEWEDSTLDEILASEYPRLKEAYRRANAEPFSKPAHSAASNSAASSLEALRNWHEANAGIIREGLQFERDRFSPQEQEKAAAADNASATSKTARARA